MYDTPRRLTYSFSAVAFNGADIVKVLKNPTSTRKGRVSAVALCVTTTFAGATTTPKVQVGDGVTANKYADVNPGALAAGAGFIAKDQASGLVGLVPGAFVVGANGADLTITFKAATGAGAAGVSDVFVEVDWL